MGRINPENFKDRDEPVNIDMDPEAALRLLLAVDPDSGPVDDDN